MDPFRAPLMSVVLRSSDLEQSAYFNNVTFILNAAKIVWLASRVVTSVLKRRNETKYRVFKS